MLPNIGDVAPKGVIVALAIWAVCSYFVFGPEIAERVLRADRHIEFCQGRIAEVIQKQEASRLQSLRQPQLSGEQQSAISVISSFSNSELGSAMDGLLRGLGVSIKDITSIAGGQLQEATREYERQVQTIQNATATKLESVAGVCGCIADRFVAATRNDWALFAGSFSAIRTTGISSINASLMAEDRILQCTRRDGLSLEEPMS